MDEILEQYVCHPQYFCPSRRLVAGSTFLLALPDDWTVETTREWSHHRPRGRRPLGQGWKIHVSCRLDEGSEVLALVARVCHEAGVPFKHLRTRSLLRSNNVKRAPRAQSGKFITIYPDGVEFDAVADALHDALRGRCGPYVLSDIRLWDDAPIHARFGAFVPQFDAQGVPVVVRPDGVAEPDERVPWFVHPSWAVRPSAVAAAHRNSGGDMEIPFEVDGALSLTNSGGVYEGRRQGRRVVIKEARPHTDAVPGVGYATDRLRRETEALRRTAGLGLAPDLLWSGPVWEHEYLVTSRLEGSDVGAWVGRRLDLYTSAGHEQYLRDATTVVENLEQVVGDLHAVGITHGDLHPGNVLVREDLTVALLDFEYAGTAPDALTRQIAGTPGFRVMEEVTAAHIDWVCARQLAVYTLMRLAAPTELDSQYWRRVVAVSESRTPATARSAWAGLRAVIERLEGHVVRTASRPTPHAQQDATERLRAGVSVGLRATRGLAPVASGKRYPTHPYGLPSFGTPSGLAFGDACVDLIAGVADLEEGAAGTWPDVLRSAAGRGETGLFDGVAGELFVRALTTDGDAAVAEFIESEWAILVGDEGRPPTIWSGRAGVLLMALTLLDGGMDLGGRVTVGVYDGIQTLSAEYARASDSLMATAQRVPRRSNRPWEQQGGLFYGHLGFAWLFAQAAARYDDAALRDAAVDAARLELTTYVDHPDAGLQREECGRRLPYFATGSAGFGTVLTAIGESYLPDDLRAAAERLWQACSPSWTTYPGLFNGHAGLLLGRIGLASVLRRDPPTRQEFAHAMEPHLLTGASGLEVAGDAGFRITGDLASGAAGVLFADHALENLWSDPLVGLVDLAAGTHTRTSLEWCERR